MSLELSLEVDWQKNDVELLKIFFLIKEYCHLVLSLTILTTLVSVFFIMKMTSSWEATANIKVGHIGLRDIEFPSTPVEPNSIAALRIKDSEFIKNELTRFQKEDGIVINALQYKKSLRATPTRDDELIELKLQAQTPEVAKKLMLANIEQLKNVHNQTIDPFVENLTSQKKVLAEGIERKQAQLDFLTRRSPGSTINLQFLRSELNELEQKKLLIEQQLLPSLTYSTKLIGKIEVTKVSTASKKISILLFAILGGLALGCIIAFGHKNLKKSNA